MPLPLRTELQIFRSLPHELGVPFVIASVHTDMALLEERLALRSRQRSDPSEANADVLEKLQEFQEPLQGKYLGTAVTFFNNGGIEALQSADETWKAIEDRLG